MTPRSAPALFLDRDGVINEEVGYLFRPEEVRWVEGIFPLIRTARRLGYRVVVVTNQSGIARGLYTTEDFGALMHWLKVEIQAHGGDLDAVYHCPFHPVHGVGSWKREHRDRKPGPGMLLRAAHDLVLDLSRSVLVGDRCTDIAAAHAAGLRMAFLKRGTEAGNCNGATAVHALSEVEAWLLRQARSDAKASSDAEARSVQEETG